jgi:hypothetical protein
MQYILEKLGSVASLETSNFATLTTLKMSLELPVRRRKVVWNILTLGLVNSAGPLQLMAQVQKRKPRIRVVRLIEERFEDSQS